MRYLIYMCLHFLAIDLSLGNALLIDAHGCKVVVDLRVTLFSPIGHNAHHDLLPRLIAPCL